MTQLEAARLLYAREVADLLVDVFDADEREDLLKQELGEFEQILRSYWT